MPKGKMKEFPALYFFVAKQIRKTRESLGVSQNELAIMTGMARVTITNIENGNQGIELIHVYQIARALECQLTDLLPPVNDRVLLTQEEAFLQFLKEDQPAQGGDGE